MAGNLRQRRKRVVIIIIIIILIIIIIIITIIIIIIIMSLVTGLFFPVPLICDPHRSGFNFETALLSVLSVAYRV
jgi:hypothetical protein